MGELQRTYDLVQRMRDLGADDPQGWARSELDEDIPQEARWLFLRHLWAETIDDWTPETVRRVPAAQRALSAGAAPADIVLAMRAAAYEAVFGVVHRIDEGHDYRAPADAPGWALMETRFDETQEAWLTGRQVGGLHEDVLSADPSGRDGSDLWQ